MSSHYTRAGAGRARPTPNYSYRRAWRFTRFSQVILLGAITVWLTASWAVGQLPSAAPPVPALSPPAMPATAPTKAGESDADVLTRGPVHEGFAEQVSADPRPGIIVPKQPPAAIDEIPPEVKPEGDDVTWIPGYWFWDDERKDFLWVSGVWRRAPPERQWVPGYWQAVDGGYQWVSGFWGNRGGSEPEYVETPPASLEVGPSSPAPSANDFWIPGSWLLSGSQYRWRPGFWQSYYDGWTWVCGRYVWTPGGCVYVPGYWDYPLTRRGCLFAPVYFHTPVYRQIGYRYRPQCWIGYSSLLLHLFVRPSCNHYYFGDYYAAPYRQHYFACTQYYHTHRGYSPLYTYYQHYYRQQGIDYVARVDRWHEQFTVHRDLRPAHTWAGERHRPVHASIGLQNQYLVMGRDLHQSLTRGQVGWKPQRITATRVEQLHRQSHELVRLAETRRHREAAYRDRMIRQVTPPGVRRRDGMTHALPGVQAGRGQLARSRNPKNVARQDTGQSRSLPGVRTGPGKVAKTNPVGGAPARKSRPPATQLGDTRAKKARKGTGQPRSLPGARTGRGEVAKTNPGGGRLGRATQPPVGQLGNARTKTPDSNSVPHNQTGPPRKQDRASSIQDLLASRRAEAQKAADQATARVRQAIEAARQRAGRSVPGPSQAKSRQPLTQTPGRRPVPNVPPRQTPRSRLQPTPLPRALPPNAATTRNHAATQTPSLRDFLASQTRAPRHEVDRVTPGVGRPQIHLPEAAHSTPRLNPSTPRRPVNPSVHSNPSVRRFTRLPSASSSVPAVRIRPTPPTTARRSPGTSPTVPHFSRPAPPSRTFPGPRRPASNSPSMTRGAFGNSRHASSSRGQPSITFRAPTAARPRAGLPGVSHSPSRSSGFGRSPARHSPGRSRGPARSFRRPEKPSESSRSAAGRALGHGRH